MIACRKEGDAQVYELVRWGGGGLPAFMVGRWKEKW